MGVIPRRAAYRVRQFFEAVVSHLAPLKEVERAEAHAVLPEPARRLFDAMPRNDQRHSLQVLRALRARGYGGATLPEAALLQAALLHDAAKAAGDVTLLHRVAVVLLKAFRPNWLARWRDATAPSRNDLRYPFWALVNHPELGAHLAAEAGCLPEAVLLIRRHQDPAAATGDAAIDDVLAALQAADDDH